MSPARSLLVLPLALCACDLRIEDHVEVDGIELPVHHEEVLTLETWPVSGLAVEAVRGDVAVESAPGPITLTVVVYERLPGEAHAEVVDGKLVARAGSGGVCAIGAVRIRGSGPVHAFALATGMGDVRLAGVAVEQDVRLATGVGDVELSDAGAPRSVEIESGTGDLSIARVQCVKLQARTGVGDVSASDVAAETVELSSGIGDIDVARSKGASVEAETGVGSVVLAESTFERKRLDSGLGSVKER